MNFVYNQRLTAVKLQIIQKLHVDSKQAVNEEIFFKQNMSTFVTTFRRNLPGNSVIGINNRVKKYKKSSELVTIYRDTGSHWT